MATQGSSQYDTDYVTKYEIQTSLDRENWQTYKENGTNKVNMTNEESSCYRFYFTALFTVHVHPVSISRSVSQLYIYIYI